MMAGKTAAEQNNDARDESSPDELRSAILSAAEEPESPFHLKVNCTDGQGIRSFILYSGGVTVWGGRSQFRVPPATRTAILKTLLEQGFPDLQASYGGRKRAPKEAAAPRISCAIFLRIANLQKSSVQKTGGEQSAQLTGLAANLLDQVEAFSHSGIGASDLQDALDKLIDGELAPETLTLRFMELPGGDYFRQGYIVRLRGGRLSRQAYTPGSRIGDSAWQVLEKQQFTELVMALQQADITKLPGNLWSQEQLELEIQVLAHKKIVLARPFSRLDPASQEAAQQRFQALLSTVRKL